MDDSVQKYRERRAERLAKKNTEVRMDAVERYRERRTKRMQERMDSGLGWLFGIATDLGIDTAGKEIPEIFELVNAKRAEKGLAPVGKQGSPGKKSNAPTNKNAKLSKPPQKFNMKDRHGPKIDKETFKEAEKNVSKSFSDTCTTKGGASYPKPKDGAKFDMDVMKEVQRQADEGGKGKEYDEFVKNLKPEDYVYMKDPVSGDVIASVPGIAQKFDTKMGNRSEECQQIYDSKIQKGQQITKDMIEVVNGVGSRLSGLENCYKGASSASRKVDTKRAEDELKEPPVKKTDEQYISGFGDVVRFTVMSSHDGIVDSVSKMEKAMTEKGYKQTERENKWVDGDGSYKAVHLQFESPTGERFEVQVHSSAALGFKNKGHHYYEQARKQGKNKKRKKAATEMCKSIWATCPEPKEISKLKSFKS